MGWSSGSPKPEWSLVLCVGLKMNEHWVDENGNPAGGITQGVGFTISWQNGPLGTGEERKEPNGAFVENVILAGCCFIKRVSLRAKKTKRR